VPEAPGWLPAGRAQRWSASKNVETPVPASKLAGAKAAASCTHSKASLRMPCGLRFSIGRFENV